MKYDLVVEQLEEQIGLLEGSERENMLRHIEIVRLQLKEIMGLND